MVTFSIPGDEAIEASNATPRSRPGLAFSKRGNLGSPYNTAPKRLGTPHGASARKTLNITRDGVPSSSLNRSFSAQNSIFNSSHIDRSPKATPFSPSLSHTPMKKVFAPGATPEPSRVQREAVAHATPRGVAARAKEKDLFTMRIEEPSQELTGEALAKKVPKDWDPRGSIYADQFLGHLCPPELDDEQRRQYFCILDLRRLKFAADEIFCRKGWKLNVLNFAKEFEKSRSIILLHYDLYEFQNVKPSKDLIKKWRREHGLPALEDDEADAATPSKPTSTKKKRKASDDGGDDARPSFGKNKRVATDKNDDATPAPVTAPAPAATPVLGKNKRKASVSDETEGQPSKVQKAPSSARSLFEKAANKTSTTPSTTPAKSNLFAPPKQNNSLMQSVLKNNAKTDAAQQPAANGNIFGHLSDSSAKNSSQEDDAESETDSEPDESPEEPQGDEPPAKRPAPFSAVQTGTSSDAGTRESTPGRSLFDRVTKDGEGQPVRAETPVESTSAPKDQTWNPSTTPIKFAPSGGASGAAAPAGGSLFGANTGSGSLFPTKSSTTTSSNLFGAPKADKPAEAESSNKAGESGAKDGDESDKENDSTGPNQTAAESKPAASQPAFGSLFQPKTGSADATKDADAAKPAPTSSLFGASASKPAAAPTSNLFGGASKPAEAPASSAPVLQSSTLFGAKAPEPEKAAPAPTSSLFGASTTPSSTSNIFGNSAASAPSKPLFGNASATGEAKSDAATPASAPSTSGFTFGSKPAGDSKPAEASQLASKPLFGAPKSPPAATGTGSMFDGSPMKQDDKSPAKPLFGGASNAAAPSSTPQFSFGGTPQPQSAPSSNLFGAASNPPADTSNSTSNIFGGNASAPAPAPAGGSGAGFNFSFGGGGAAAPSSGTSFNNPFSSGGDSKSAENAFSFGSNSSAPSAGGMFQFGGNSGASTPAFGGNQSNANGTPSFGAGSSAPSGGPVFSFGAGSSQPQANSTPAFGNNQGSTGPAFLQPPSGGASTGTNTPSILGGGSSLATTPARGTPEPSAQADGAKTGNEEEDGEKHEQINLTDAAEEDEEVLHEVRAKVLKFVPADKQEDGDKPKPKSPWSTQGVGSLRLLKHKETGVVRLLLRAEPRGHVALNRALLSDFDYKADEKYVKLTTSNEKGDGLETWMLQVKTKDSAKTLAEMLEKNKDANKK